MSPPRRLLSALTLLLAASTAPAAPGLKVPDGFEVAEFADGRLADDIFCLTTDPRGRVVVSGRGYVRLLEEGAGGKAVRALDFAGAPADGAMGLFWDGDSLLAVGGGGLLRWRDAGGAGRERPPEVLFRCKTGGEHDAHAVRRGPDGWLYLLCGNATNVAASLAGAHALLPSSPVKNPVAGCVVRFPPDFRGGEIVAHGFRNAYGMDFNADGELFTYDSDNERCVSLPWYEGTRLYHVTEGGNFGWRSPQLSDTWRLPPGAADVVAPLADLGRGSPTGVVCYRHAQFPARYRGGLFLLDWTFGRVWFVSLARSGSTYRAVPELFLQSTGENGFAPTAAAVHPVTGDLFVSIGGRGTRGAVYRVRHAAGLAALRPEDVRAPQPPARSHDWRPGRAEALLADVRSPDLHVRRRALDEVRRHRAEFLPAALRGAILAGATEPDRGLRQAAARLLGDLGVGPRAHVTRRLTDPWGRLTRALAEPEASVFSLAADGSLPEGARVEAVRLLQRALGDVTDPRLKGTAWEGYSRRSREPVPEGVREAVRRAFPSGLAGLDRELGRTLAMLEDDDPTLPGRVAGKWAGGSSAVDDLHYLIVLGRLRGPRAAEVTRATASALLGLDAKLSATGAVRDSNWPARVAELHAGLSARDPALDGVLLALPEFGRPDHALFARRPGFDRAAAAGRFLARSTKGDFAWNADLIGLVGELPAGRSLPVLRGLWGEAGLDEVIVPVLARHARPEDRERLQTGLLSPAVGTVRVCLGALARLPAPAGAALRDETLNLVAALRGLPPGKEAESLKAALAERLRLLTGEKGASADDWVRWAVKAHPDQATRFADPDGVDGPAWDRRLAGVDWAKGDAAAGRAVFVKASCSSCHSGSQALGPDLAGVTGRFSRADLFTAILRPSKDVSPRYRTVLVSTADGKVYQGLVVYDAADSLILQTGPGATVRLDARRVTERQPTARSLMPAGLLDRATDRELADLYAYLRSLGVGKGP